MCICVFASVSVCLYLSVSRHVFVLVSAVSVCHLVSVIVTVRCVGVVCAGLISRCEALLVFVLSTTSSVNVQDERTT